MGQIQIDKANTCIYTLPEVMILGSIVMLFSKDEALKTFLNTGPLTDDVYESILDARREDAEYAAAHESDRERML